MSSLDRYRKLEALGEGGAGTVYRALDTVGGEVVALKLLHPQLQSSNMVQRMAREVRSLRQLNHPAIVRVYDAGLHEGLPFLVMDFVEGETLTERVRVDGPLGQREAAELVLRLSEAVAHAHDRRILHRDVKPDNVLLDRRGRPYLTDFGLALELHDMHRLTRSGAFLGTPGFLAPEQAKGEKHRVGPATDVYGLGAVLYYALTGRVPIEGATLAQVVVATVKHRPAPVRQHRPEVDPALEAICLRCLEKDSVHRFDGARYLGAALEDYLDQGAETQRGAPLRALALVGGLAAFAVLVVAPRFSSSRALPAATPVDVARSAEPATLGERVPPTRLEQQLLEVRRLLAEGRGDRAKQAAAEATALDPRALEAWLLRGEVAFDLGEPEEALAYLERVHELDPKDPREFHLRGRVFVALDQLDDANAAFTRSLELREDGHVRLERALNALERGRREEALADARQVLAQGPPSLHDYDLLLEVFEDAGSRDDHARTQDHLLALPLERAEERLARAEVLVFTRPDAALFEVDELLADDPVLTRAWIVRGRALAFLGRPAEAIVPLSKALVQRPERLDLLQDRARAYLQLKRLDEALDDWERVIEHDPEAPYALSNLAYTYLLRSELEDAEEILDQLAELAWIPAEGHGARALFSNLRGDHLTAVNEARQALAGDKALEWPRVVLAKSLEALGRRRQALAIWREIEVWHRSAEDRAFAKSRVTALESLPPK